MWFRHRKKNIFHPYSLDADNKIILILGAKTESHSLDGKTTALGYARASLGVVKSNVCLLLDKEHERSHG